MWDLQLEKIEKIFKSENLEIHSTKINLTQKMNKSCVLNKHHESGVISREQAHIKKAASLMSQYYV